MSWHEIKTAFGALVQARDAAAPMAEPWALFKETVTQSAASPPYHLDGVLGALKRIERARDDIAILDHGCGSGATLLYLLARGYTGIHGVDVGGACAGWNTLLAAEYGIEQPRFFVYDGKRLPLGDESIDLVFSQEVLEHVAPDVIDSYYGEEARVLRPGGIAFHQVPHRLAPYDSHTGTWLLHYLPRPAYLAIHRRFGEKADFVENQLFLRWPWVHRRAMRRHFGGCSDLTLDRLQALDRLDYYDGPAGLRRFVGQAVRTPVIGVPAGFLLKNLVMLDTLSVKGRRNPRSDAK